ncbi:MAG TPA: YiiD C-terminal domain-containing protein [Planctomycetaceae bacterium]
MADLIPADALTRYLHDHIPLTRHMGIVVAECGPERVVLSAPLGPNVNHRETAFGGSLSGAAILAGWTWLHARLAARERRQRLVIHESNTAFERAVDGAFEAVCESPPANEFDRFLAALDRRGKARMTLESRILCRGEVAARHTGRYVALAGP